MGDLQLTAAHIGQPCRASVGGRHVTGTLRQIKPKGLVLTLSDGTALDIRRAQLVSIEAPRRTLTPDPMPPMRPTASPSTIAQPPAIMVSQPKEQRMVCEPFLAYVRTLPCCNCAAPSPSDPHHEGPRGVGQKTHDVLAVPLCRPCHRIYTDTNRLPDGQGRQRSRADTLVVLRTTQRNIFLSVLSALDLDMSIECFIKAIMHAHCNGQITTAVLSKLRG